MVVDYDYDYEVVLLFVLIRELKVSPIYKINFFL